jgi:PAS domain S-box-containing protein
MNLPPTDYVLITLYLVVMGLAAWNVQLRHRIQTQTQSLAQAFAAAGDRRFRDLFEAAPVALTFLRGDRIEIVNERFLDLFGLTRGNLINTEDWWHQAFPDPAYRRGFQETWSAAIAKAERHQGVITAHEYRVTCGNGQERVLLIGGRLREDGLLVTLVDLTEDRRLQEQLRHSEERLTLAMEATTDGLWDWNILTNEGYCSPPYFTMLGFQPDDFPPTAIALWFGLLHPDDRDNTLEQARRRLADPGHYELEFRLRTRDGGYKWILSRGKVVTRDADGNPVRAVGTHTDLTARKQLELALRAANAEQEAILETATSGIALIKDGILERCNHKLHEMFGWLPGQMAGQPTTIWYPDGEANIAPGDPVYAAIWRGEAHRREQELLRRDGSRFWARLTGKAVDIQDPVKGTVWIIDDISAERAAVEEMRRGRDLAEEATRMKSDFLANMSHEIRTPMNAILGILYLALKADLPPAVRTQLGKAQGAAHSLLGILNDILDFSKMEAGKMEIEAVEFSLDTLSEHLTDTIGPQAELKGIRFLVRHDTALPPVLVGDPLRIGQILLNLCGNALKFTEAGEIELAFRCLTRDKTQLLMQVCVRDTGIGMAPGVQNRLFQKFNQADQSTTRRFGGTGLGLAITRSLVELMDGRIWIEKSQPGQGSTFCLTLPLRIAPQAQFQRRILVAEAGRLLASTRVLVVDDNQVSRRILTAMLKRLRVSIATAASGAEALNILGTASPHFDLVLMDWRMPGMNGDEATQRIQGDPAIQPKPKVVIVTAHGREDVIRLAEQAGVNGFLIKPVTPSLLLDTLISVLGRERLLGRQDRPAPTQRTSPNTIAGARILLVEDNDINREFATELLIGEGLVVAEAINGLDALDKVRTDNFDAVLMDIQMPVMDGLEATRHIRSLADQPGGERFARLPIIAMTALAMAGDADKSKAAGMNDHVTKPVDPDLLMATLHRWVRLPAHRAGAVATPTPPAADPSTSNPLVAEPDEADLLASLANLDTRAGIHRIGGKIDAYRRQLFRFRQHYSNAVQELEQRLTDQGLAEARAYCHALKGVTGNLGALALFNQIAAIDNQFKQDQVPDAAALEALRARLGEVMADIDRLNAMAPPPGKAPLLEPRQVRELLGRLDQALAFDLGAAEPLLEQLTAGVVGTPLAAEIAELGARVDLFEIDAARESLAGLQQRLESAS